MAFNSRGVTGGVTPASFRFQRERREETVAVMMLTGGVHLSARGRERESNGSGRGLPGLRARSGAGLNGFPGALFSIFILLSSFPFLFSLILSTTFQI
jgi:hypothetical protein